MKKLINIKLYKNDRLENTYENIPAIIDQESFKFKLDDVATVINDRYFQRENEEYKFKLDFINNEASFLLKTHQQLLPIEVEKLEYKRLGNILTIVYKIASDEEEFKIYIEEKED